MRCLSVQENKKVILLRRNVSINAKFKRYRFTYYFLERCHNYFRRHIPHNKILFEITNNADKQIMVVKRTQTLSNHPTRLHTILLITFAHHGMIQLSRVVSVPFVGQIFLQIHVFRHRRVKFVAYFDCIVAVVMLLTITLPTIYIHISNDVGK